MEFAISLQELTKDLATIRAVDHLSLRVPYRCIFGLLGPNGAGKTTTLRMLAGHLMPTSGKLSICGFSLPEGLEDVKRNVGFLSGGMHLYGTFTPRESWRFFGRLRKISESQLRNRIDEIVERFQMAAFCDQKYSTLSQGQKQRALIANTILHDPKLLILDEITASLDIVASSFLVEFVREERDRGKCIVFSTHVMSEAEYLCDDIALLYRGKILDEGSSQALIQRHHSTNLTEAFLSALKKAS